MNYVVELIILFPRINSQCLTGNILSGDLNTRNDINDPQFYDQINII